MTDYIAPGTAVRLVNHQDGSSEHGVIVHCWFDQEIKAHDCYVAFFGPAIPDGQPDEKPYVLRYAASSLARL